MSRRQEIEWGAKPVYPPLSKEGILIALLPDGVVKACLRDEEPVVISSLTIAGTGKPWIPKHGNFNKLAKQMYREGDLDQLIKRCEQKRRFRSSAKIIAPQMAEFIQRLIDDSQLELGWREEAETLMAQLKRQRS